MAVPRSMAVVVVVAVVVAVEVAVVVAVAVFAGKVGCRCVKMRGNMTDMCLSGQRVADMLADMSGTQHKKLSAGVPGQHVTACHLLTCRQYVGNMTNILQ